MSDPHLTDFPENPVYAFCPIYDPDDAVQQICIVFQGLPGYVATEIGAPDIEQAHDLCDRLNRALGHDRETWQRIAAQSLTLDHAPESLN